MKETSISKKKERIEALENFLKEHQWSFLELQTTVDDLMDNLHDRPFSNLTEIAGIREE